MSRTALLSARESLQENLLALLDGLPDEAKTRACDLVVAEFAPLLVKTEPRKSVFAVRIGDVGYRVEKTTNFLDLTVGKTIPREQAEKLIADGIQFSVGRNR